MKKVLWSALLVALLLTLLISGSSCTKTVYVTATPAPTSASGQTPTPTSTQSQVLGTELIYQADLSQIGNESTAEAMLGAIAIIDRRLDAYGISEAVVQKLGYDQIVVQLPGGSDVEGAINLIDTTAQLEFKEMVYDSNGNPVLDSNGNPEWIPATAVDSSGQEVPLTGQYLINNAQVVFAANTNAPEVAFEFNSEGATLFSQITGRLIGKPLGIFLDNNLISSPTVKAQISASGVINNIPLNDAKILVIELNAGALPCPLKLIWRHSLTPNPTSTPTPTPTPTQISTNQEIIITYSSITVTQLLFTPTPGNIYLVVNITVENDGYNSFDLGSYGEVYAMDFYIVANGVRHDVEAFETGHLQNYLQPIKVPNGGEASGNLVFQVPTQTTTFSLEYGGSGTYNIQWIKQ